MKNNSLLRIILIFIETVLTISALALILYLLLNTNEQIMLLAIPLFAVLLLAIGYIFFFLRFRLKTDNYDYHNAEYESYRADIEEKIRELQNAINKDNAHWADNNHLVLSATENKDNLFEQFGVSSRQRPDLNTVFMLMPFNPDAVKVYDQCKKTVRDLNMNLSKSDDIYIEGDLLKAIVTSIVKSEIIIANLDGKNPNVFYELGIAHTLRKPTILITSYDPKDVPFNLQSRNIIFFSNMQELDQKLSKALQDCHSKNIKSIQVDEG